MNVARLANIPSSIIKKAKEKSLEIQAQMQSREQKIQIIKKLIHNQTKDLSKE